MKNNRTDKLLLAGALGALAVALFAKSAGAKPAFQGNVQTATVADRVYSVVRLGQGFYLVTLVSTGGVLQQTPVDYTFNQTQQIAANGDPAKLAQLKSDMNSFNVNFQS